MKILSWNIRDAGRTGFKAQLVEIARSTKPDLILLLETKVHTDKASKIIKPLSYENSIEIPTEGLSGGIWLLWNSSHKFQFHFISFNNRFIHGQINDYTNNTAWLCTCVYGYPQQYLQKNLWNQISNLSSSFGNPFTWHNRRQNNSAVFARLNRAVANHRTILQEKYINMLWSRRSTRYRELTRVGFNLVIKTQNSSS